MHAIFFEPPIEQNFLGHQMAEVYRDGVYYPLVEGRTDMTILDIGANIGVTTYFFSRYANRVISLEPSTEHFTTLVNMLEFNQIKNVTPIKKALYIKPGSFTLFKNPNKTMFSLHQAVSDPNLKPEEVETITLATLFEEQKIDKVDLMKLDVEGSEVEILSHTDFVDLAPRIEKIILERHAWSGRHPQQTVDALEYAGYKVSQIKGNADLLLGVYENKKTDTPTP